MPEPLSPQYDPKDTEAALYRSWEEHGFFRAHAERVLSGEREPYTIVIPPPNVTAPLHIGHGLNNTLQDVLVRWRRMQGREALWLPGTDHAGIATQNVVERVLAREGRTREDLGREAFVARVWEYVRETERSILAQLRAIGSSCDWSRTRFTLDEGLSRAVREVFVRLHEKGLVYRGNYIINWCPRCLTALSEEEAEPRETEGALYHLRYPLAEGAAPEGLPRLPDGRAYVVVATTRPETMLGDTAVAVHPEDERYRGVVGARVELPLTGRTIPVIADAYVDPEFGTGAVKITPAHDPNDFAMAERHGLEKLDIMTPEATMGAAAPAAFRGLDRLEARRQVVEALRAEGLLEGTTPHAHAVPHCYRCDTVVEPRLSEQWFVRMKPLAERALEASRSGRVRFTPERWTKIYEHWLENIHDWCISRQLWWGHRIPVWYCRAAGCEETIVAREDPGSCPKCGGGALEQDPDVLDTWFSSWLWPFSTLGWPDESEDLEAFYPTTTLVSAYDIIFFWVSRMIMAGLEFMGEVPFQDVYITTLVRDHLNRKMSKSLGNGIDPLEVVERYGADVLRYTVVEGATWNADILMNYEDLDATFAPGRNFANKVWNAGRFALMNLGDGSVPALESVGAELELADRWMLSRLGAAVEETTRNLEAFRFHETAETVYHFFWDELADWYIELVKPRLRGEAGEASRGAARATLVTVLDGVLRLLHPIMPFLSEALWLRLPWPEGSERAPSLVVARWPAAERRDAAAESAMDALMELIRTVRALRSEYGVPPSARVSVRLTNVPESLRGALAVETRAVGALAGVAEVLQDGVARLAGAGAHAVLRGGAEVFVPLADVIDLEREKARLAKELERLEGQLGGTEGKLANEQFVSRAPAEVVGREREKAASLRDRRDRLAAKLRDLS